MSHPSGFSPYVPFRPESDALAAARSFHEVMRLRRSVRFFDDRPVPRSVIEAIVATAGTAPSGANKQPWRFVAVGNAETKRAIREAAEAEEQAFYERRANEAWLDDLRALGTDEHKPFLEIAPWLIVAFKLVKDDAPDRRTDQVYYVNESMGIATGMLITAIHLAGLVTLTHTPSPMRFLGQILGRSEHERPFLLLPVGYPAADCVVPDITRKPLDDILVFEE